MRNDIMFQEAVFDCIDAVDTQSFIAECEVLTSLASVYVKSAMLDDAYFTEAETAADAAAEAGEAEKKPGKFKEMFGKVGTVLKKIVGAIIGFFKRIPSILANAWAKIKKFFADKKAIKNSKVAQAYKKAGYDVKVADDGSFKFLLPECMSIVAIEEALKKLEESVGAFKSACDALEQAKRSKRGSRADLKGILAGSKAVLKATEKRTSVSIMDQNVNAVKSHCDKIAQDINVAYAKLQVLFDSDDGNNSDVQYYLDGTKKVLENLTKAMANITKGGAEMVDKAKVLAEKVDLSFMDEPDDEGEE